MGNVIKETPQPGTTTALRIVAKNYDDKETLINEYGFTKRRIYLLKQKIKNEYPEFLRLYNPSVAADLLA